MWPFTTRARIKKLEEEIADLRAKHSELLMVSVTSLGRAVHDDHKDRSWTHCRLSGRAFPRLDLVSAATDENTAILKALLDRLGLESLTTEPVGSKIKVVKKRGKS